MITSRQLDDIRDHLDPGTEERGNFEMLLADRQEIATRLALLATTETPDGKPVSTEEWEAIVNICRVFLGSVERAGGLTDEALDEIKAMDKVARRLALVKTPGPADDDDD